MELMVFLISMGMLLALAFVGIGVVIGDIKNSYKSNTKDDISAVCGGFDYSSVHNCRTNYVDNSDVGDIHGQVNSGQDMEYVPTVEQLIIVLESLPKTAYLSPHETNCVEWATKIIEKLTELLGDVDE